MKDQPAVTAGGTAAGGRDEPLWWLQMSAHKHKGGDIRAKRGYSYCTLGVCEWSAGRGHKRNALHVVNRHQRSSSKSNAQGMLSSSGCGLHFHSTSGSFTMRGFNRSDRNPHPHPHRRRASGSCVVVRWFVQRSSELDAPACTSSHLVDGGMFTKRVPKGPSADMTDWLTMDWSGGTPRSLWARFPSGSAAFAW